MMDILAELKAKMEKIRDRLIELEKENPQDELVANAIRQEVMDLQNEGKRLGNEFRRIRQEQIEAVKFAEGLVNNDTD